MFEHASLIQPIYDNQRRGDEFDAICEGRDSRLLSMLGLIVTASEGALEELLADEGGTQKQSILTKLFRAAEFDKDHLPEAFDIWRGGVGQQSTDWHGVAFGISWTRNRDVACWFALRPSGSWIRGEPLVLKRTIDGRDVLSVIR
jgi:hypothetical protein